MESEQKGIGQELSVVRVSKYYGTFRALLILTLSVSLVNLSQF